MDGYEVPPERQLVTRGAIRDEVRDAVRMEVTLQNIHRSTESERMVKTERRCRLGFFATLFCAWFFGAWAFLLNGQGGTALAAGFTSALSGLLAVVLLVCVFVIRDTGEWARR